MAEHQKVMDAVTHGWLFQLDAPTTANISVLWSQSRGTEGQRGSVCLCSRLCFKASLCSNDIIPAAKLLKVNGPQHQKRAWRRTPSGSPHLCPRNSNNVWMCTKLMEIGNAYKKNRWQQITKWLALCKPRYILKISGKNGRTDNITIPTSPPWF